MAPHLHMPTKKAMSSKDKKDHAAVYEKPKKAKSLGTGCSLKELEMDWSSPLHKAVFTLLHNVWFDYVMGLVIMVNFVVVIIETDTVARDQEPPSWIGVSGWIVLVIFVMELMLRMFALGLEFFSEGWNLFDFGIVFVDSLMSLLGLLFGSLFPVSALRVLRLSKLARVSKVFRVFPELREMMAGLVGSLRAIFWGSVLMIFALVVWAVLAVQFIHPINQKVAERGVYEQMECERCPEAFASVFQATLTFCQQIVAGDSWGQVSIPIIDENNLSLIFFAGVFVSIGMAVLNLILGVVVNIATQAHDSLETELQDENLIKRMEVHGHLLRMCAAMDEDDSGELTKEELFQGYKQNENFQNTLADMDIGEEDLEILWTILDADKSGKIEYEEFVSHCYRMKLSDTQFMLAYIKFYITIIKDKICDDLAVMNTRIEGEEKKIEAELEQVEIEERKMEEEECAVLGGVDKVEGMMERIEANLEAKDAYKVQAVGNTAATADDVIVGSAGKPYSLPPIPEGRCASQPLGNVAIDSQMYAAILEESRQQRADFMASVREIKSMLDYQLQAPPLEQKLNNVASELLSTGWPTPSPQVAPQIPKERWPVSCCSAKRPEAIVQVPSFNE